jgi:hypothetical protein
VILGAVMSLGALLAAAALLKLHSLSTDVNPIHDPVSNYGAGPFKIWYQIAAVALGTSSMSAAGFVIAYGTPPTAVTVLSFLVAGVARWAITVFPTDLSRRPVTATGRIHEVLAILGFAGIATGAGTFASAVSSVVWLEGSGRLLDIGGTGVVIASIAMLAGLLVPALRTVFGAFERLFYLSALLWFVGVGTMICIAAR